MGCALKPCAASCGDLRYPIITSNHGVLYAGIHRAHGEQVRLNCLTPSPFHNAHCCPSTPLSRPFTPAIVQAERRIPLGCTRPPIGGQGGCGSCMRAARSGGRQSWHAQLRAWGCTTGAGHPNHAATQQLTQPLTAVCMRATPCLLPQAPCRAAAPGRRRAALAPRALLQVRDADSGVDWPLAHKFWCAAWDRMIVTPYNCPHWSRAPLARCLRVLLAVVVRCARVCSPCSSGHACRRFGCTLQTVAGVHTCWCAQRHY